MTEEASKDTTVAKRRPSFSLRTIRSSRSAAEDGTEKKPSKTFRRIRGLLNGESRREKRAKKKAARAASSGTSREQAYSSMASELDDEDDEETIYGVDLDETKSVATATIISTNSASVASRPNIPRPPKAPPLPAPPKTPPKSLLSPPKNRGTGDDEEESDTMVFLSPVASSTEMLQVVLLLMDPETRRFELLQLEFDSNKAVVEDVLHQIPLSVTEAALRRQVYTGICDKAGKEMKRSVCLKQFYSGNEVLLAVPRGMATNECARLARPILSDKTVIAMLRSSGIDATPISKEELETPPTPVKIRDIPPPMVASPDVVKLPVDTSPFLGKNVFTMAFFGMLAILLHSLQHYMTSPLQPGQVMSPGMWISKCGLLSVLPSCEDSSLEMGMDGVLTFYGQNRTVQWEIIGGQCRPDTKCTNGLVVKDNGTLEIGGKLITSVTVIKEAPLTPWPFIVDPKLRLVRGKK